MYEAIDIADYILDYCATYHEPISNLKLQKLLYYAWVDYYKKTGRGLYSDAICAWQLGPVVPSVYHEYSSYAGRPITRTSPIELEADDEIILDRIIDEYVAISARELVDMTHKEGSPWDQVYRNGRGLRDIIPYALIKRLECRN